MPKPLIAVTMGDPAGVGPEVCLQLLANEEVREFATPVVFGDARLLSRCARQTNLPAPKRIISEIEWAEKCASIDEPAVLDLFGFDAEDFTPGTVSAKTGAAGYRYVEKSIEAAMAKQVAAVATAPLNKEALRAAGIMYPGHTEIFADKTGAERACMFQYSDEVRASFVTVHCGYHEVPGLLTKERILDVIELTADAMRRIRGTKPKIAVLGLNPHAGENGLFGNREEERIIIPAIEAARERGITIEGPLPPDTAFLPAKRRSTDAFICMYHDQGHIPLKALAFDTAVNTTLGLPIIRTSVDHGTACDIAWQGRATGSSLVEAVRLAAKMAA
ncbi:4-hydroxythreonine-4-phosphate dehydrogenase PdxA [Prosthecobacter sp.]|uniref:4-hydroxythreonine-4-phosphate dehydrogenase PdxA n=1 Tax=Prosthecobacter sp. TaxID=1965333 RepID=UPI001D8FA3D0|nr:4-hydroxythreonine-4-phosphate dehydrogenase PdxA [Prosthecobacter sp.]MCB1276744.1 4-hydroxythreonine-4-phosphate dehydrogenase PdxA [Prosthecobacter sp.]